MDTPGIGDTQSCEVDVANAIGILKAISKADCVHPVLIFGYRSFGLRYEILKAQFQYYSKMIINVKSNIRHFNYFFTQVPDDYKDKLGSIMVTMKQNFNPSEKMDHSLEEFVIDV